MVVFFAPICLHGATVTFSTSATGTIPVGDSVVVTVLLDTATMMANTVEGVLVVPQGVTVRDLVHGDSLVTLWIDAPVYSASERHIRFAGMTPGGFIAEYAPLFSFTVDAGQDTVAPFFFEQVRVLQHDGRGTELPTDTETLALRYGEGTGAVPTQALEEAPVAPTGSDTEPPEPFTPTVVQDAHLGGGQPTLVWAVVDKGTGVHRQYVRVGWFGTYLEVPGSYFVLDERAQHKSIYLKVVDGAGNERIVHVPPLIGRFGMSGTNVALVALAIGILLVLLLALRVRARR